MSELEGEAAKGKKTMADPSVNLEIVETLAESVAIEKDGLRACLQQSQRRYDKMRESITLVQDTLDSYSSGLKEDKEYMQHRANEEGPEMLVDLGNWMTKQVVEAHHTHLQASKVTKKHYLSDQYNPLKERKLSSAVSKPIVLTDLLKDYAENLGEVASPGAQVETSPTDGAEINSSSADDATCFKTRPPEAEDPSINNLDIDRPDADTPGPKNQRVLKRGRS